MAKKWFVLQVQAGKETAVVRRLRQVVKMKNFDEVIEDIIVPTEEVLELRQGHKVKSERKFYPGYVLIQIDLGDSPELTAELWLLLKNTTGILNVLGGSKPAPISDKEVEYILARMQEGSDKPKPKVLFEPGEVVRVIDGPFSDFNGVVEEVNYDKNRLRVAVLIFGRSTPVELEFSQVEKA